MERYSTSGIGNKTVVNVRDGANLGYVTDIEFDTADGKIIALLVGEGALCLMKGEAIRVPWCRIQCFGEDVILVDIVVAESKCACRTDERKKKRKFF